MKKLLIPAIFCLALVLAACGSKSNLEKLDGKWVADADASMEIAGIDTSNKTQVDMAKAIFSAISMEVDAQNKTLTISMGNMSDKSEFTVESDSGDTLTVKMAKGQTVNFVFKSEDVVTLTEKTGQQDKQFVMKRAK